MLPKLHLSSFFIFLLPFLILPKLASAQQSQIQQSPTSRPDIPEKNITFPQNTWTLSLFAADAAQPGNSREQLAQTSLGIGYNFLPDMSISAEFSGVNTNQPHHDAVGFGGDFLLRSHWIDYPNWTFFTDFSAGILQSQHAVPPTGTNFNFTLRTGLGFTAKISDNTHLLTGIRYLHLSNARQEGPLRNPSINAAEFYVGFIFKL
jgi:Lipid A 3-O-deacylase (PagL)